VKNHVQLRKILLGSAAVALFVAPSFAQEQMETVTVTGIRASLQSAQSIKQNASQVVDSITSTDIGALPDRNVAEALQRVPGVTLQRNDSPNDLVRMGSTGNSVFIRGMSWVQTTFNGRDEFSAIDGRTLNFADVSADLLSGVDVYKSPTAKMIEGGIGGVVDLKTRKPFDMEGRKIAISGDYTYGDMSDRALPSANALYSDRFNTGIGEIGVLASVDWQDQLTRTAGINLNTFDCWSTAGTRYQATDTTTGYSTCLAEKGHVMAPKDWAWRQLDFRQQRLAANFVLQWRPNDKLEFTLSGMNTYAHFTDLEHYVAINGEDYNTYVKTGSYNGTQWVGGSGFLQTIDTRAGTGHNRTSDLNLNAKWTPVDNLEITADFQFVESDRQYLNNTMFTGYLPTQVVGINVSAKDEPKITWTDTAKATSNPANYFWYAAMDHQEYNVAHSYATRLDATYRFGGDGLFGWFKSVDAGFRAQQKQSVARATGYNWASIDPMGWGASGYMLDGSFKVGGYDYTAMDGTQITGAGITDGFKKLNSYGQLFNYPEIIGNSVPSLWVPGRDLALMSTYDATVLTRSVNPGWGGWQSYNYNAGCKGGGVNCIAAYANTTVGANVTGNTISPQTQDTYAGYVQANFSRDTLFGLNIPVEGNIGVRYVHTEHVTKTGKLVMPAAPNVADTYKSADGCNNALGHEMKAGDPSTVITSCTDYNTAMAFWGAYGNAAYAVQRPDPVSSSYDNFLPSFNMTAHLSDTVQSRLAYSETMLRPEFGYSNNDGTLSFNWGDSSSAQAFSFSSTPSGYGGNPYLKPMHSTNYDASIEWYFSPSGSVTLSLFDKRISNYIFTQTATQTVFNPASGQSMDFSNTSYVNGTKGGVDGWEIAYQQFYDFLPGFWSGFGLQANYTKIFNWGGHNNSGNITAPDAVASGNMDLPMEGMSKDAYNIALLYAKYDIDFRLAWNWRSTYMSSSANSNAPREPVWMENYGQLDGSIFYSFLDHYKVGVQLTNITGSEFHTAEGYADYHPRVNWINVDRKFAIVVRTSW
jgi:TonB-dependent receptor